MAPAFPWPKDGVNTWLHFWSLGVLVEGLKMGNATLGLASQDSEQHQGVERQEKTDPLCAGYHPGAAARVPTAAL